MIDEKKIIDAAIQNADKYNPCRSTLDREEVCRASFKDGVEWLKQSIWHDASEEPTEDTSLFLQHRKYFNEIDYEIDTPLSLHDWDAYVEDNKIVKWCYIEDILPKGGHPTPTSSSTSSN